MAVNFNGVDLKNHMVIEKISRDVMPPRIVKTLEVPNKAGAYFQSVKNDVRVYDVKYRVRSSSYEDLQDDINTIAGILSTEEPVPIVFEREPEMTFYGICVNDTKRDDLPNVARGTMQLLMVDPYKYTQEYTQNLITNPTVLNDGTAEIHPTFNVLFKADATHFSVISDDQVLLVGKPEEVNVTRKPKYEKVATNGLSNTTGWTTGGTRIDGTVAGTMAANTNGSGTFFASSYGTGTGWHGPALKQSLPSPVQDFRFDIFGYLIANNINQIGRIEAYLLDVNNNIVAKLAMKDMHKDYENNWGEIRVGEMGNAQYLVNTYGGSFGVWNNFNGMLRIEREGQNITAWLGKYDFKKKQYHARWSGSYTDKNNEYQAPIAQIQLHIGGYGTYAPVSTASWDYFNFYKINTLVDETNVIFQSGDELEIDTSKKVVFKNGIPYMKEVSFDSDFIKLEPGENNLIITPDLNVVDVSMTYRKRWL